MKKRMIALMMAAVMGASLAACGGKTADTSAAQQAQEEAAEPAEEAPAEEEKEEPAADAAEAPAAETPAGEATEPAEAEQEAAAAETADGALRLFVLSGPTGIGAMNLWAAADAGETAQAYNITMTGANDEIVAALSTRRMSPRSLPIWRPRCIIRQREEFPCWQSIHWAFSVFWHLPVLRQKKLHP